MTFQFPTHMYILIREVTPVPTNTGISSRLSITSFKMHRLPLNAGVVAANVLGEDLDGYCF
jgi:hypothetical protein